MSNLDRTNTAYIFILLAGLIWAVQPVFLLVASQAFEGSKLSTLVWNFAGRIICLGVLCLFLTRWKRVAVVFLRAKGRRELAAILAFDFVFFGGSYVVLTSGETGVLGNLSVNAILFESWPIISSLLLIKVSGRKQDRSIASWLALVLFICGFITVIYGDVGFDALGGWGAIKALLAGVMMGCAVAGSQFYMRRTRSFFKFRELIFFTFLRAIGAVALFGLVSLLNLTVDDLADLTQLPARDIGLSVFIGGIAGFSPVLLHLGSSRVHANIAMSGVLIGPAFGPLALALIGYGTVSDPLLIGICMICSGIALAARIGQMTSQYLIAVMATIVVGSWVVLSDGLGYHDFYAVLQSLAVFYGLFQAAVLSQLVARHDRLAELVSLAESQEGSRNQPLLRLIGSDPTSASEVTLLTFTGLASMSFIVVYRVDDLGGDIVAYIISVTTIYLLVMSWVYHLRIRRIVMEGAAALDIELQGQTVQRQVSLVLIFAIMAAFFAILIAGPNANLVNTGL